MDASAVENDLVVDQTNRSAEENAEPDETIARLPGETPEGLRVESLEERALLSANPAAQTAAAARALPPEEPPALIGSPVAGASAADAGEVVAELAKTTATGTGDGASEHKTSHSTESGEMGEVKLEAPTEHAVEINESERLERGTQPENKAEDRAESNAEINSRRRVAGELHDEAPSDALVPAIAANTNTGATAAETQDISPSQRAANGAASEANPLKNDLELSTLIDHLGTDRAGRVAQIETLDTAATRAGELASSGLNSEQAAASSPTSAIESEKPADAANSAAALAEAHAQQVMADLHAAERADGNQADAPAQPTSAPQQRSQSVDTPQAHDAYFAATPDLAAYPGVESAVAAPVLSEPSGDGTETS